VKHRAIILATTRSRRRAIHRATQAELHLTRRTRASFLTTPL
jgi:hypothetical protein